MDEASRPHVAANELLSTVEGAPPRQATVAAIERPVTPSTARAPDAAACVGTQTERRAGGSEERADRTSASDERTATEPPF